MGGLKDGQLSYCRMEQSMTGKSSVVDRRDQCIVPSKVSGRKKKKKIILGEKRIMVLDLVLVLLFK